MLSFSNLICQIMLLLKCYQEGITVLTQIAIFMTLSSKD